MSNFVRFRVVDDSCALQAGYDSAPQATSASEGQLGHHDTTTPTPRQTRVRTLFPTFDAGQILRDATIMMNAWSSVVESARRASKLGVFGNAQAVIETRKLLEGANQVVNTPSRNR